MNVVVKARTNYMDVYDDALFTQGISHTSGDIEAFIRNAIVSEHSPLRSMLIQVDVYHIPYYVHVHYVRHHVGVQPFVRSQRPDCWNPVPYDRDAARQDAPVDMRLVLNAQSLLNIMKKRLCAKADPVTRQVALLIREALLESDNLFLTILCEYCLPACKWAGGTCHEAFGSCGLHPLVKDLM